MGNDQRLPQKSALLGTPYAEGVGKFGEIGQGQVVFLGGERVTQPGTVYVKIKSAPAADVADGGKLVRV